LCNIAVSAPIHTRSFERNIRNITHLSCCCVFFQQTNTSKT